MLIQGEQKEREETEREGEREADGERESERLNKSQASGKYFSQNLNSEQFFFWKVQFAWCGIIGNSEKFFSEKIFF